MNCSGKILQKKFSVGLTLQTTEEEFSKLLDKYCPYIKEVYFSLPLGDRFHTRKNINNLFLKEENISKFWVLLNIVKKYSINLELALNTYKLDNDDIIEAATQLHKHNIKIDSVVTLEKYVENIKKHFPNIPLISSYNNEIRTIEDIKNLQYKYDSIVIGGAGIRNENIWKEIKVNRGEKVKLLLNNGCSFNCGWCSHSCECEKCFNSNIQQNSPMYLYALQSIMPYEIHNSLLDVEQIDLLKISNRSDSIEYLDKCLHSYIHNENKYWIEKSYTNYLLWCRLSWFYKYYKYFEYEKVVEYKKIIYENNINM